MGKKTVKHLIQEYIEENNLNPDTVGVILNAVWKETHRVMDDMEHMYVGLPGLGAWGLKYWEIDKELEKWESIHRAKPCTTSQVSLSKLKRAKELWKKEKKERDNHKENRKEWIRKNKGNNDSKRQ